MPSLNLFFLLDVSRSMARDGRIAQLNTAFGDTLTKLVRAANEIENADIAVRVIYFSDDSNYLFGTSAEKGLTPREVFDNFQRPLEPMHTTQTHLAIDNVIEAMHTKNLTIDGCMDNRILAPIVILFTDGYSADHQKYLKSIEKLRKTRMTAHGHESILRIAIGVYEAKTAELEEFASVWPTVVRDDQGTVTTENKKQVYYVSNTMDISKVMRNLVVSSVFSDLSVDPDGKVQAPIDPEGDTDVIDPSVEVGMSADLDDFV